MRLHYERACAFCHDTLFLLFGKYDDILSHRHIKSQDTDMRASSIEKVLFVDVRIAKRMNIRYVDSNPIFWMSL